MDPSPGARLYRVMATLPRGTWPATSISPDDEAVKRIREPEIIAGASVWLAPESKPSSFSLPPGRSVCAIWNPMTKAGWSLSAPRTSAASSSSWSSTTGVGVPKWTDSLRDSARESHHARATAQTRRHRIVLEYPTPGLRAGAAISALCLLILGLLGLSGRRRRTPAQSPMPPR